MKQNIWSTNEKKSSTSDICHVSVCIQRPERTGVCSQSFESFKKCFLCCTTGDLKIPSNFYVALFVVVVVTIVELVCCLRPVGVTS